jgi:hypothetical protein
MQKYQCSYVDSKGRLMSYKEEIQADDPARAARLYSEKQLSVHPRIMVESLNPDYPPAYFPNERYEQAEKVRLEAQRLTEKERLEAQRLKAQSLLMEKEKKEAARLSSFQKLYSEVEENDGNLAKLSYQKITMLVENMKAFPGLAKTLNPREYDVREKLYKAAFFDRNLQAGLQAQYAASQAKHAEEQAKQASVQTDLLNKLNVAVGNQPSGGSQVSAAANNTALIGAATYLKLNQMSQDVNEISEDTADISEGFGFD